jgi:hypothetical protein
MLSKQRPTPPVDAPSATHEKSPIDSSSEAQQPKRGVSEAQQPPPDASLAAPQQPTAESQQSVTEEGGSQNDDWRWNELFSRITNIENRLAEQEQRQQQMRDFQWHRLNQSNIQNRSEDSLIKHWETQRESREKHPVTQNERALPFWSKKQIPQSHEESIAPPAQDDDNKSFYSKWKAAMWRGLSENLDERKEAMEKYGVDIMDRAWGFWTSGAKENDDVKADPKTTPIGGAAEDSVDKKKPPVKQTKSSPSQPAEKILSSATDNSQASIETNKPASSPDLLITPGKNPPDALDKAEATQNVADPSASQTSSRSGLWHWFSGSRSG